MSGPTKGLMGVLTSRRDEYRRALALRPVRRLWAAGLISELGDWAARLALTILVFRSGGHALGAAMVAVISMLPWIGPGQVLSTLADRYSHRSLMIWCNLLRTACFGLLASVTVPVWLVLVIAFVAALAEPPFEAARTAATPLLAGESFGAVQMLFNTTRQLSILVGYGLGGLSVAAFSPRVALGMNAVSFALNVALVRTIPTTRSSSEDDASSKRTSDLLKQGGVALWRDPMVRIAAIVVNVSGFSGLAAESMVVVYSAHLGHPSGAATGLLATVMPISAILAASFWPTSGRHQHLIQVVIYANLAFAVIAAVVFFLDPGLPAALLAYASLGVLEVITVTAGVVVISRLPVAYRGSSMGFLSGSLMLMQLLGATAAGGLAQPLGIGTALGICSLPAVFASLVVLPTFYRLPQTAREDLSWTTDPD
jgi:MFS family permease